MDTLLLGLGGLTFAVGLGLLASGDELRAAWRARQGGGLIATSQRDRLAESLHEIYGSPTHPGAPCPWEPSCAADADALLARGVRIMPARARS
jgi:hypothetical protein